MRKFLKIFFLCLPLFIFSACGTGNRESLVTSISERSSSDAEQSFVVQSESVEPSESSSVTKDAEDVKNTTRQISVQFGNSTVIYELNDSVAADSLYEQLPLTIEVEDYSTNEKIFYPPQTLDTDNTPLAQAGAGTLAYYAPWGDVVLFYGDYNENLSLYELGQVVSGGDLVSEMSGTITVAVVE